MNKIKYTTLLVFFISALTTAQVGIKTTTPNEDLHVHGDIQITGKMRLGGDETRTGGDLGTEGQVLTSSGSAAPVKWTDHSTLKGALSNIYSLIGTTQTTVNSGVTRDVPGLSQTITVAPGKSKLLAITVNGYAVQAAASSEATQGAFAILVDNVKVSSGYVSAQNSNESTGLLTPNTSLVQLPTPTSFTKTVTIGPGTHIIKVTYKSWTRNQIINVDAFAVGYSGADAGDNEAMKTRLTIFEFNN